jgi:hypothetical protein
LTAKNAAEGNEQALVGVGWTLGGRKVGGGMKDDAACLSPENRLKLTKCMFNKALQAIP